MTAATGSTDPGLKLKALESWDDNTRCLQVTTTKDTHDVMSFLMGYLQLSPFRNYCARDNNRFAASSRGIIVQRWLVVEGCAAMAFQEVKKRHDSFSLNGDKTGMSGLSIVC
jgi:uncharacterized protein with NRDE domain